MRAGRGALHLFGDVGWLGRPCNAFAMRLSPLQPPPFLRQRSHRTRLDACTSDLPAPPRRLSLRPYDLSPSYANVFNKFSVRYFINLVLVDEEDRRYFKQQVGLK